MFKVEPNGENRLDIEFSGKLDKDDMKTALDDMVAKAESIEHGRMLYRVGDFDFPTLGAIGVEMMIGKFDRCAVVADKSWVRAASELEGMLMPGLQIKSFEPGQEAEAEAEAWLAE